MKKSKSGNYFGVSLDSGPLKNIFVILFAVFSVVGLGGCSTASYYQPEVDGPGAKWSNGNVVYSLPPDGPILRMKLVSAVQPKNKSLRVRMYFRRKSAGADEYLDPNEQSLSVPDSSTLILPSRIHASNAGKPLIKLADTPKQLVELHYVLPKGGVEYPYIILNWKIHYKKEGQDLVMAGTERFDYVDASEIQRAVGQYGGSLEFPAIGEAPDIEWSLYGRMWW